MNDELMELILDIDAMTTVEFCNKYAIPHPNPVWCGDTALAVADLFRVDAIKWNMVKQKAKEIKSSIV